MRVRSEFFLRCAYKTFGAQSPRNSHELKLTRSELNLTILVLREEVSSFLDGWVRKDAFEFGVPGLFERLPLLEGLCGAELDAFFRGA